MDRSSKIQEALNIFKHECKDLLHFSLNVPIIEYNLNDPYWFSTFYRDYVSKNIPVKIRNGYNSMPALIKWDSNYLLEKLSQKEVIVAVTPNGYADGLLSVKNLKEEQQTELLLNSLDTNVKDIFMLPQEVKMTFNEFMNNINEPKSNCICYIQRQDSNLTEDFPELVNDVEPIFWAEKAFGKHPDAVNFWMGDSRAITSMHKDFYENIYCVMEGYKDFILIPPTDLPHLTYNKYKVGKYNNVTTSDFDVELQKDENGKVNEVPWLANDPLNNKCEVEKFSNANLYHVRVEKGECLYLPSLWFHHVRQSHGCIALNYWYDMDFDVKWCYYKLLEKLT